MLVRLIFFLKDFWYPFLFYALGTSYLLLVINFVRQRVHRTRPQLWLINGLVFVFLVWQIGYVWEVYFRFIYDQTDSLNNLLTNQRWEKRHIKDLNQLIGVEQFRDSKDFREAKQPQELKIAVVGDSIAYGTGIEKPEDRFSNLLEAKLNNSGLPAKVYNMSRPGDNLPQARANFDKIFVQGDFDLIIWQLFPNDLPATPSADTQKIKALLHGQNTNPLLKDLLDRSYAFNFFYFHLWGLLDNFRSQHLSYQIQLFDQDEIWLPARGQIIEIVKAVKNKRIPLIAALFPYTELIGGDYPVKPHQMLAEVFNKNQVTFIDLLDTYQGFQPKELMANRYDLHPNELAHRLAAEIIFEKIAALY